MAGSRDLVVLEKLTAGEMTAALAGEIRRVLQPWYGVAALGFGAGVSTEAKTWAQTIGAVRESADLPGFLLVDAGPFEGAEDGRELWRLRGAPKAGQIMLYGQPGSQWPALSNPLVPGERVIVSAGLVEAIDGIWAIAANAATGEVVWERRDWASTGTAGLLSGAGQFCRDGEEVLYHGGE